jgi:FkbM family methyltransferase
LKKIIKFLFSLIGFQIKRIKPKLTDIQSSENAKSIRTKRLSYYETTTGNYFLPTDAKNDIIANTIIGNDIFEIEVVELACKYIKENTVVLDIGANYGQMSILFSNKTGERGIVYSFDADDFIFEILKKNIEANNKQKNIIPIFGAVHNVADETLFFPIQDFIEWGAYGSYGIDYNTKKGRPVKSITIDSLNIQQQISFMKIDIQGGDLQAMQGAIKTIEKNKMPILFEYEYHFEEKFHLCFQDYIDFVKSINYKFVKTINGHNYLIMPA